MISRLRTLQYTVAGGFALLSLAAPAITIDFEGLEHGRVVNTQYAGSPWGVTISVDNFNSSRDIGVAFNTNLSGTRDPDLESPWSGGNLAANTDLGNILIIQENGVGTVTGGIVNKPDDEAGRPAGSITLTFSGALDYFGFDLIDVEGPSEYGSNSGYFATFYMNGSEVNRVGFGDLINSSSPYYDSTVVFGDNKINRISPIIAGENGIGVFDQVVINFGGSAGIDNLVFDYTTPPDTNTPVPEPATMALMGMGLAGMALRSRKNRDA